MGRMMPLALQSDIRALRGQAPVVVQVRTGRTLLQMLEEANGGPDLAGDLVVVIGGQFVPRAWWGRVRPKPMTPVYAARKSLHGGSSGAILRLAAVAALTYFTFGAGGIGAAGGFAGLGTGFAGYAAATGAFMLGSLAVNALVPVANTSGGGDTSSQSWNQLTGTSNQLNQWGVIPCVLGEYRIYPPKAAITYTETLGEDSWIRVLLDLGFDIDPDDVLDLRVGDTPFSGFQDIQYEITTSPTLYTSDVAEESVGVQMDDAGDVVQRTTAPNVTAISLDIIYSGGLFGVGTSGKQFQLNTYWQVEYCATGTEAWQRPGNPRLSGFVNEGTRYNISGSTRKPFAVGIAWDVPAGQYDVRVTRVENPRGGSKNTYVDTAVYAVLRSIRDVVPSTTGTTKLALRMRTSDDLNGSVDSINCLIRRKIRVYDRNAGTWSAPQHSLNPAWVVYWLMTECKSLSKHVSAARQDLESWADYAEFCDLHGFQVRTVVDAGTTARVLINKLLGGALASIGEQGGRFRPVFDEGSADPEWTYTAMEIENFKATRVFTRLPQALRVQFVNPDANYADDEIIVLDDGYSYRGVDARGNPSSAPEPVEFETLQLQLAMTPQQAWRLGRYHFAQAKFRRTTYTIDLDIAGLPARRGALIEVPHDVIDSCVDVGRVTRLVTTNVPGGYAAMITLDETMETEDGVNYKLQLRSADGRNRRVLDCKPYSRYSRRYLLSTVPTVEIGDGAVLYVASQEIAKVLVTNKRHGSNYATSLTAVDYDARVAPYWANPPADLVSEVTGAGYGTPDVPVITSVVSTTVNDDSDDAGIKSPVVHIGLTRPSAISRRR